jgi:hypothetical protein
MPPQRQLQPGNRREPVKICWWIGGWCLVGNGPSYLLFCPNTKEVIHLASGLHRQLRGSLKGYSAIGSDGELLPLVRALALSSSDAIYDVDPRPDAAQRKWATYVVVREIEALIRQFRSRRCEREIFERGLHRLTTLIKAAGQYQTYHAAPGVPELKGPPGSFFAHDTNRERFWVVSNPRVVYRCVPDSPIAGCAQSLWRQEQARWGDQCTVLYRVPIRKELRVHLCVDEPAITKLARAEGFDWLPRATRSSTCY